MNRYPNLTSSTYSMEIPKGVQPNPPFWVEMFALAHDIG
jgi:hypothetical protein